MNIQFKKGVIELCMFSLLLNANYSAYEIVKKLTNTFRVSESALYPLLRRLTQEGYFDTYFNDDHSKKLYKITDKGITAYKEYLNEWLDLTKRVNMLLKEDGTDE